MKNLIGAVAPTNRVLRSFKILMLIVLVAIGFTSCKDQSKSEDLPKTEFIAKTDLHDAPSNFDTGGGKSTNGGLDIPSDTGGKGGTGTSTSDDYCVSDTGGRGSGTGTGDIVGYHDSQYPSDTGGGKGTSSDTGQFNYLKDYSNELD